MLRQKNAREEGMKHLSGILILAVIGFAPCAVNAAADPAALLRKAETYAFEAKQYGAAGKPTTNTIAKRYAQLNQAYRARASEARTHN